MKKTQSRETKRSASRPVSRGRRASPVTGDNVAARAEAVLARLRTMGSEHNRQGMARFGITIDRALGISVTALRPVAKELGRDHDLACALWGSGIHEARLLAILTAEPKRMTLAAMKRWAMDCDSWDLTDQLCGNVLDRTPHAVAAVRAWSGHKHVWLRRAAFALMAALSVHDKKMPDEVFESFLPLIESAADDERNWVKKAVNWALRSIGKRNRRLMKSAIASAERIRSQGSSPARWIAADALRELRGKAVLWGWD